MTDSTRALKAAFYATITASTLSKEAKVLQSDWIDTPIGTMVAIGDEKALYLLEFLSRCNLAREIIKLQDTLKVAITIGKTKSIDSIKKELRRYFKGELELFLTQI